MKNATRRIGLAMAVLGLLVGAETARADLLLQSFGFQDQLIPATMALTYDGSSYWSISGGSPSGVREARYDAAGNLLGTYSPGLDFRSIFTDQSGNTFAREFADSNIYKQVAPGTFSTTGVVLSGGYLDPQASVVLGGGTEYDAMNGGPCTAGG